MALDPTARRSNIKDSIKKWMIDNIATTSGIPVTFDKALNSPNIQGKTVKKWVSVQLGDMRMDVLSDILIQVYCCTREDNEGFILAQLCDTVVGYFSVDPTATYDGMKRIPFYQSHPIDPWTEIGGIVVTDILESAELEAPDETKFKVLTIQLRVPSKV